MNNTVFAGAEARNALMDIKGNAGTDWCVADGRCTPWKNSTAGRQRYAELKARHDALQDDTVSAD